MNIKGEIKKKEKRENLKNIVKMRKNFKDSFILFKVFIIMARFKCEYRDRKDVHTAVRIKILLKIKNVKQLMVCGWKLRISCNFVLHTKNSKGQCVRLRRLLMRFCRVNFCMIRNQNVIKNECLLF